MSLYIFLLPPVCAASDYEYLVVGILINHKEVATLEVLRLQETFFIPLESE